MQRYISPVDSGFSNVMNSAYGDGCAIDCLSYLKKTLVILLQKKCYA